MKRVFVLLLVVGCKVSSEHDNCVVSYNSSSDYSQAVASGDYMGFTDTINGCANLAKALVANQPNRADIIYCVCKAGDERYQVKSMQSAPAKMCGGFGSGSDEICWSIPQYK
jgi:hypothetical protein